MTYSSYKRTGFSVEFTSNNKHFKICTTFNPVLDTGRFDIKSFRFMLIQSRCTWLKEREIFTPFFLVNAQTILEVIEIAVQFHCLSSYRNRFGSKRSVSIIPPLLL